LQGFGSTPFAGFDVEENIWFNNGIGPDGLHRNLMFGSDSDQHLDNVFEKNLTYFAAGGGLHQFNMFGGTGGCHGLALRENVLIAPGRVVAGINRCDGEQVVGNRFYGSLEFTSFDGQVQATDADFRTRFPENEYYGAGLAGPSGTWAYVFVNEYLPDAWEHRRIAHAAVYNWDGLSSVGVDLGAIEAAGKIAPGTVVTVRPAQNLSQSAELLYTGSTIEVPMTGWTPIAPAGRNLAQEPLPATFPDFGAFVLEWPAAGPEAADPMPRVLEDPGAGLAPSQAWAAREAAWRTEDSAERAWLRLEREYAWRMRTLDRVE
jgi:hypothetical protein